MNSVRLLEAASKASDAGQFAEAERLLREALAADPQNVDAINRLAMCLQVVGRFSEASGLFRRSLGLRPSQGLATYTMVQGQRWTDDDRELIDSIERAGEAGDLAPENRVYFHYALAKVAEDLGDYERAMRGWNAANSAAFQSWFVGRSFDRDRYRAGVDWTSSKFDGKYMRANSGGGSTSSQPIFVVGMMRSGTTMVEQILSSHPEVGAGGELPFWLARGRDALDPVRGTISSTSAKRLATEYLKLLTELAPGKSRVTDKMPQNTMMLGIIHLVFPEARIVHVRRDAMDNCLSIYTTAYRKPPDFALNQGNIAFAYREYQKMMRHWDTVIPADRLLDVDYEALILEPESTTRRLIDFCGLPWSDQCLKPEENPRAVRTPSLWQVRQPLYTNSIGRWKHYEPWLGEMVSELG